MKRRICVVVTARPSYSRIKTALRAIEQEEDLELQLVVAASALLDRYGSAMEVIEKDGFKIDAKVYMVVEGENLVTSAKTTGLGIVELSTVFDNLKPDAVVTIADRYETLSTAVAASYMNIPVIHVQGGEVTGSIDEKVRHAVTKLSDVHFVSSEKAYERVVRMGEKKETVHITGCPSIDIAAETMKNPDLDFDPGQKYGGVGATVNPREDYLVVLQHPVTTEFGKARQHIEETLKAVHHAGVPTYWFWPNVDAGSDGTSKGIRVFREKHKRLNIQFFKNMLPADFLKLLYHSKCIVGNSSVAIRECSFLGVPAINIGSRQTGRDRGKNVLDVGYAEREIFSAIEHYQTNGKFQPDYLYGNGNAGKKMAELLREIPLTTQKRLTY